MKNVEKRRKENMLQTTDEYIKKLNKDIERGIYI